VCLSEINSNKYVESPPSLPPYGKQNGVSNSKLFGIHHMSIYI